MTEPTTPGTAVEDSQGGMRRPTSGRRRTQLFLLGGIVLIPVLIWSANFLMIGNPVRNELGTDSRNSAYRLSAHYGYYLDPNTLALDLTDVDSAAPIDLFRGLFQAAKALHTRHFGQVRLERSHKVMFTMSGEDFDSIGSEYDAGQNPVYLIRTLPEKLSLPDGTPAFGHWEGGLIGLLGKQMQDVNDVAGQWARGQER